MSFREKSAWISLLSVLIPFGYYFTALGRSLHSGQGPQRYFFFLLVACVIGQVAIQIALHVVAAVQAPKDAQAAKDERERLIELKSTRIAFYVLVVGVLMVAGSTHLGAGKILMANGILLALVLADLVRYSGQIVYFRRGC